MHYYIIRSIISIEADGCVTSAGESTFDHIGRASGDGGVFVFVSSELESNLSGMRFTDCCCSGGSGGAISGQFVSGRGVVMDDVTFTGCSSGDGGGISLTLGDGCSATLSGTNFTECSGRNGGGTAVKYC